MPIRPEEFIPTDRLPALQKAFDKLPPANWSSDGRKNASLERCLGQFAFIIRSVTAGNTVPWQTLCDWRKTFAALRVDFYTPDQNVTIERIIAQCIRNLERTIEPNILNRGIEVPLQDRKMVTVDGRMVEIIEEIKLIADTDLPVLVLGESGVGKELIARIVHEFSARTRQPFKALNCSAVSAGLLEATLFGHKKGAFTSATTDSEGFFTTVGRGTLFLDEIGDMDLDAQAKILRVLEERRFHRVGDANGELAFHGRVVASTNQNLREAIRQGRFRQDLYYRIAGLPITIPPLRERPRDIYLLTNFFLTQRNPKARISDEARKKLMEYSFPGNVRELKFIIHRAYNFATAVDKENPIVEEEDIRFES